MKFTPSEIKQKNFSVKSFGKGYDREQVNQFLMEIADEWEKLLDEIKEQRIKLELMDKELQKQKEVESSLYRTLKTAEDTSANIIEQARKQADLKIQEAQSKADYILNEARLQGKHIVQKAQQRSLSTLEEMLTEMKARERVYKDLESYKDNFLLELKNFMQESVTKLDRFSDAHTKNYFAGKIKEAEEYLEDRQQVFDQASFQLEAETNPKDDLDKVLAEEKEAETKEPSFFDHLNA
ncbi:MAG: DivIVA domain-containing protein [Cytophagia bacterium]|nr:MAG: DivIVA domain-containing protein [Cytophagales bacterium]TAG38389.1 MAG: DivIVA domain-containing protein [Cytophagia bacterium]